MVPRNVLRRIEPRAFLCEPFLWCTLMTVILDIREVLHAAKALCPLDASAKAAHEHFLVCETPVNAHVTQPILLFLNIFHDVVTAVGTNF